MVLPQINHFETSSSGTCRLCGSTELTDLISFGKMPLVNSLLSPTQLNSPERMYPLEVVVCCRCTLAQITDVVPPSEIFTHYLYFSSFSDTMLAHAREAVHNLITRSSLNSDSLVIELASNDGYLLQYFLPHDIPVLGIEPAHNVAEIATAKGIPTICEFFGATMANRLRAEGKQADLVIANNVIAHVPELHDFVDGIRVVLKREGLVAVETPYIKHLIEDTKFDTIYHEHLFYYSLTALKVLFEHHQMHIVDVEEFDIHGGSLRLYVRHQGVGRPSSAIEKMLADEASWVRNSTFYSDFSQRVERLRGAVSDLINGLKSQGRRIAAYGAGAKGAVFLNAVGLGTESLDFVVDRNVHKQGLYMPGCRLPIHAPEYLLETAPDYLLILTWNFADEILKQQAEYARCGGKFIVCTPTIRILV